MRIGHQLEAGVPDDLGLKSPGDEDDADGLFLGVGAEPASYLFSLVSFSAIFLRHRQPAIFLYTPEVHGHQNDCDQRQHHAMQNVKSEQGVFATRFPPRETNRTLRPMRGIAETMLVPTVIAQKAS